MSFRSIVSTIPLLVIVTALSPFYFYKLGQSSLVSWDEAWYGAIAKNILKSNNFLLLEFNAKPYLDHPPFGFWVMAVSMKAIGISDFSVRFGSAAFGLLGLVAVYFLGKDLFNKTVGLCSSLALSSSLWYLYRSRSGNLDIYITVLFIVTLLFACKFAKERKYLTVFAVSLSILLLTKTAAPLTIIPAILLILFKSKTGPTQWLKALGIGFGIFLSWIVIQSSVHPGFLDRYLHIGLPGIEVKTSYPGNLKLMKEFLHSGIGKWFWPGVLGIVLGPLFLKKKFTVLSLAFLSFFAPFLMSTKGQIWHLVPLHPLMILSFFGVFDYILRKVFGLMSKFGISIPTVVITVILISFTSYYSFIQLRQSWYQFIDIPAYRSDEEILSKEAKSYPGDLFIDDDFIPAAVYYSDKKVNKVLDGGLKTFFEENDKFLLITYPWRMERFNIAKGQYRIIKSDRDKVLVQKL